MSHEWLDRCAAELRRRRVPRRVAARLLGELRDHFADLAEEDEMSQFAAEIRMGEPSAVAEQAAVEHRRRAGAGKWLALGAIPTFLGALILAALLSVGIALWPQSSDDVTAMNNYALAFTWWMRTAPWVISGALLCWWSARIQARRNWLATAFLQLAVLAAIIGVNYQPKTESSLGSVVLGLTYPPSLPLAQLPALALVVVFAAIAWTMTTPITKKA